MNLIKNSVKRRVTVAMFFLCVVLLGCVSLTKIGVDLFPKMDLPITMIMTNYTGAGSEEVEQMVTKPIESVVGTVQGVDTIQSTSSAGSSMVMVSFDWGTDLDFAGLQVREKLSMVQGSLPEDVSDPIIMKMDPSMMPIMSVAVSGSNNLTELKDLVDSEIKPLMERQAGVASVNVGGGYTQQVEVSVEPVVLENYGITMNNIIQSIQMNNMNMAAGTIVDGAKELSIRVMGKFQSISALENVNIVLPSGSSVLLKDIATVKLANKAEATTVWQDGTDSVYFAVMKQSDANTLNTANNIKAALDDLQTTLPPNVQITTVFNQADMIQSSITALYQNLIVGAILAMLILFMFLRSLKSTLVIGLSIPIALISTCVLMFFAKMTLNMMTLGGLVLGVGMMVDSSIVILENIQRMRTAGMSGEEAAIKGTSQLVMAVVSSTLTTVVMFLPIVFTEGIASVIFKDLAMTISFSLLASLIVAVTLVPMLSSKLISPEMNYGEKYGGTGTNKVGKIQKAFYFAFEKLKTRYVKILEWSLNHRKRVCITIVGVFILSFGLLGIIGMEFIPSSDSGQISVAITLNQGASLKETEKFTAHVEDIIKKELGDNLDTTLTIVGGGMSGMAGSATNASEITIQLKPLKEREASSAELSEKIRVGVADLAGAKISVAAGDMMSSMMGGMGGAAAISVAISGDSLDTLDALAEQVKLRMARVGGAREIKSSLDDGVPELQLKINENKTAVMGLTVPQVANAISGYLAGTVASKYTKDDGSEIDILIALPEEQQSNLDTILSMQISSATGMPVQLRDVVTVEQGVGPITISRTDQVREITVSCTLVDTDLNTFTTQLEKQMADIVLPQGYAIVQGGSYQEMTDAFSSLFLALLLGVVLVYMVMASLFESLVQPFIILFAMPTAMIGVFFGLFITGNTLSVPTFIGIIMLMGIVVNNGIVLIDYVNILRQEKNISAHQALLEAGATRLRPILMTALTTILGMLPMAFSTADGAELSRGMAVAVAFGLTSSTFLTLVFVPVIYSIFEDFTIRAKVRAISKQAKISAKVTGRDYEEVKQELIAKRQADVLKTGGVQPKKQRHNLLSKKPRAAKETAVEKLMAMQQGAANPEESNPETKVDNFHSSDNPK